LEHRIKLATICLHISVVLYLLIAIGAVVFCVFFPADDVEEAVVLYVAFIAMAVLCLLLAAGIEIVVGGLKGRKFWAWVVGLIIFGLYLPSLFFPLGALGLWGLLDSGSRRAFGVGVLSGDANTGIGINGDKGP